MAVHPKGNANAWVFLAFLALTTLAPLAPVVQAAKVLVNGCIKPGTFDPKANYFSTSFKGQLFTRNRPSTYEFSVRYFNYYKVVKDLGVATSYVLYQCGAPKPNLGSDSIYLEVPIKAYAVNDDVTANFLQLLGVQRQLKAAPAKSMVDPCMQKVIQKLPARNPSIPVFSSFFSAADFQGSNISFSASFEKSPLRRAEWVKYLSLFFNAEDRATAAYRVVYNAYLCNKRKALAIKTSKPLVGWLSYYSDSWTLSAATYKTQYTLEAGGRNPTVLRTKNDRFFSMKLPTDVRRFQNLLATLDVVIDESYLPSGPAGYSVAQFKANARLTDAQANNIKFLTRKNLWSVYGLYAPGAFGINTGWFEGAIAQPQIVLRELAAILRPAAYPGGINHYFLYNVITGPRGAVTAANCKTRKIYDAVQPSRAGC